MCGLARGDRWLGRSVRVVLLERFLLDVNRNGHGGFPRARKSDSGSPVFSTRATSRRLFPSATIATCPLSQVLRIALAMRSPPLLKVAASTAVRWLDRWTTTGSIEAMPGAGHSRSPLKAHERWLLDLVAKEPDLTLEEIRDRLRREKKLDAAASSVWRFYDRNEITFKKRSCTWPSRIGLMSRTKLTRLYGRAPVG
jgi:transposase